MKPQNSSLLPSHLILLLPALGFALGSPKSHAADYYVSPGGSDASSNSGTSSNSPFGSIQRAANLTQPGDTVWIMNGTYTNPAYSPVITISRPGTSSQWIKYKAYPGHAPKLQFNYWQGIQIENSAAYIEINGLEVVGNNDSVTLDYATQQKNTPDPLTNGNGISTSGPRTPGAARPHHLRIVNSRVRKCGGAGIAMEGTDYSTVSNNDVFDNCWYTIYAASGIDFYQNAGIDSSTATKNTISNNRVYNNRCLVPWIVTKNLSDGNGIIVDDFKNTQNGSTLGSYAGGTLIRNNVCFNNGGAGINIYSSEHVKVINNTTCGNGQIVGYAEITTNSDNDVTVANNIAYARSGGPANSVFQCTNTSYSYNLYFNSSKTPFMGANDLNGSDPKFIQASTDPSIANFRLQSTSPAIDSASNSYAPALDFDSAIRPIGSGPDRGAFEYGSYLLSETEAMTVVATSGDTHRIISSSGFSAGLGTILDANAVNDYVIYEGQDLRAQSYRVRVGLKKFDSRGQFQASIGAAGGSAQTPVGSMQDEYSSTEMYAEADLGVWSPATAGSKWFRFAVTGKNSASSGYTISFDYIKLTPQ